ncbi:hypothetical protein WJX82_002156 [Trebouxia sp. C0006]
MRQQVTQVAQGQNWQGGIQQLPKITPGVSAIPTAAQRLHSLDSRACAALLKDLSKNGLPHHALAIFDWLQSLPSEHELSSLCDTFTYPTASAGMATDSIRTQSPESDTAPANCCLLKRVTNSTCKWRVGLPFVSKLPRTRPRAPCGYQFVDTYQVGWRTNFLSLGEVGFHTNSGTLSLASQVIEDVAAKFMISKPNVKAVATESD